MKRVPKLGVALVREAAHLATRSASCPGRAIRATVQRTSRAVLPRSTAVDAESHAGGSSADTSSPSGIVCGSASVAHAVGHRRGGRERAE